MAMMEGGEGGVIAKHVARFGEIFLIINESTRIKSQKLDVFRGKFSVNKLLIPIERL